MNHSKTKPLTERIFGLRRMLCLLFCMAALALSAQNKSVTGTISDEKGEPLIGANILVKGQSSGVSTDINGKYILSLPTKGNVVLIVSYIGFESKNIVYKGESILNIVLREDNQLLDEVVVVGYGQMRKSDLTGAVSSVKINEAEAGNSANLQSLIQGKAAGVQITVGDASPGAAVNMKIRGTGSLTGDSEPLYVIDGIVMSSPIEQVGGSSQPFTTSTATNGLSGINPRDIESMEILKDASATAIYGSLGANGVVLITTKSGKSERPKVQYSGSVITSMMANKRDMVGLDEYVEIRKITIPRPTLTTDGKIPMDWQEWSTQQAWSHNHRLSISGKTDQTNYYISGGYASNQGIVRTTGNEISDFRINLDQQINKQLKIGTKSSFSFTNLRMTQGSDSQARSNSGLIRQMTTFEPYRFAPGSSEGEGTDDDDAYGPAPWINDFFEGTKEYRILSSVYLNYKFNDAFTLRLTGGADYRNRCRTQYYGMKTWYGRQETGMESKSYQESLRLNFDAMLYYTLKANKHRLDATAGLTTISSSVSNNFVTGNQFLTHEFKEEGFAYGNSILPPRYQETLVNSLSGLFRGVYSYDNKYVLTATFRADGTSKFAPQNRFSYFPSFALAYRMDQERFMRNVRQISNLKIRLGWGLVGNQAISAYQTQMLYNSAYYVNGAGTNTLNAFILGSMVNPGLRWETTEQFNGGIDIGLFKNRINLSVDAYYKRSYNLLQTIEMPLSSGYSTMSVNRGEIENKGVEITADFAVIKTRDFSLNIGGNISLNRNKILNIGLPVKQFGKYEWAAFLGKDIGASGYFKSPANIFIEGEPVALFYGIQVDGIVSKDDFAADEAERLRNYNSINGTNKTSLTNPEKLSVRGTLPTYASKSILEPGDPKYVDIDGDGDLNVSEDRTIIGNPNPKFTYGINLDFSYRDFYINCSFNGVYGNQIINSNRMLEEDLGGASSYNLTRRAYESYWYSELDANGQEIGRIHTDYPRLKYTGDRGTFTSFIVEDGSFLRLSNLIIGYNFRLSKGKGVSAIGVNLSARNLFCITQYTGYDPEVNSFSTDPLRVGLDWASYPNSRSYSLGVTLDF